MSESLSKTLFSIRANKVFIPSCAKPRPAYIFIASGVIDEVIIDSEESLGIINSKLEAFPLKKDYGSAYIFPGAIDINCHTHSSYSCSDWKNIAETTKMAARGGVTCMVDHPMMIGNPTLPEIEIVTERIKDLKGSSKIDFGVLANLNLKSVGMVKSLEELGVIGYKLHLLDPVQNEQEYVHSKNELVAILKNLQDLKEREFNLFVHPVRAGEKEISVTSPLRREPLERRIDLNYKFKEKTVDALKGEMEKGSSESSNEEFDNGKLDLVQKKKIPNEPDFNNNSPSPVNINLNEFNAKSKDITSRFQYKLLARAELSQYKFQNEGAEQQSPKKTEQECTSMGYITNNSFASLESMIVDNEYTPSNDSQQAKKSSSNNSGELTRGLNNKRKKENKTNVSRNMKLINLCAIQKSKQLIFESFDDMTDVGEDKDNVRSLSNFKIPGIKKSLSSGEFTGMNFSMNPDINEERAKQQRFFSPIQNIRRSVKFSSMKLSEKVEISNENSKSNESKISESTISRIKMEIRNRHSDLNESLESGVENEYFRSSPPVLEPESFDKKEQISNEGDTFSNRIGGGLNRSKQLIAYEKIAESIKEEGMEYDSIITSQLNSEIIADSLGSFVYNKGGEANVRSAPWETSFKEISHSDYSSGSMIKIMTGLDTSGEGKHNASDLEKENEEQDLKENEEQDLKENEKQNLKEKEQLNLKEKELQNLKEYERQNKSNQIVQLNLKENLDVSPEEVLPPATTTTKAKIDDNFLFLINDNLQELREENENIKGEFMKEISLNCYMRKSKGVNLPKISTHMESDSDSVFEEIHSPVLASTEYSKNNLQSVTVTVNNSDLKEVTTLNAENEEVKNRGILKKRLNPFKGKGLNLRIETKDSPRNLNSLQNKETKLVDNNKDEELKTQKPDTSNKLDYLFFLAFRPAFWEHFGISFVLECIQGKTFSDRKKSGNLTITFTNVGNANSVARINKMKLNVPYPKVYVETSLPFLFFCSNHVKKHNTNFKSEPPITSKDNQLLLQKALMVDIIDFVGSFSLGVPEKYKLPEINDFRRAFSGLNTVGFLLPALWTCMYFSIKKRIKKKRMNSVDSFKQCITAMNHLINLLSYSPSRHLLISERKGSIEAGKDADLVIWEPFTMNQVSVEGYYQEQTHIFNKRKIYGSVLETLVRGVTVYRRDESLELDDFVPVQVKKGTK